MNNQWLTRMLIIALLWLTFAPTQPAAADSPPDLPVIQNLEGHYHHYFLTPEHFADDLGTWTIQPYYDSLRGQTLFGLSNRNIAAAVPAKTTVHIAEEGDYYVWAHSREFGEPTGDRFFQLAIDGETVPYTFGKHSTSGWLWERGGSVALEAGDAVLSVKDTSAYFARVDAILLTNDPDFVPDPSYPALKMALEQPRPVEPEEPVHNIFLRPESFDDLGTWSVEGYPQSLGGFNLVGIKTPDGQIFDPSTAVPAVANFQAPADGEYRVWVRSRDFTSGQGTRFYQVSLNDQPLGKVFGKHGANGWAWEDGGTVQLGAGANTLRLLDTSGFYGRTDGIFLTTDLDLVPPAAYEEMLKLARPSYVFQEELKYPEWAKTDAAPAQTYVLENGHMRIEFLEVASSEGTVIQKITSIKRDDGLVPVESRQDEFGYLLLYGNESAVPQLSEQSPIFSTAVERNGIRHEVTSINAFLGGYPSWMIPTAVQQTGPDTLVLTSENDYARLEAKWSLPADSTEPVVTLSLETKVGGAFSLGMFNGSERRLEDVDFLLNPLRFHGKRMPVEPLLITEQTSASASSSMTLSGKPEVAGGQEVTYAVAVDSSSLPAQWAYDNNSRFGLGIMGRNRGVQPSLFAPVMGLPESAMAAGDIFTFAYRPVTRLDGWYDTYTHIAKEVLGLTDYRQNVEASLTDTIFNVQELMLDDNFGGWDETMKGFYNMEGENVVSLGNPLAVLQSYLLTEDKDIYERRVLPTMEYLLTRKSLHYSSTGNTVAPPPLKFPNPLPIGLPVNGFGSSVFGGVYEMTQGLTPAFRQIGIDQGPRPVFGNAPAWSEDLWMYKFTNDSAYLNLAKQKADQYLAQVVYAEQKTVPGFTTFILMSYFPNFNALLDLYETTQEQKYLDAAEESARWLITAMRTYPAAEGQMTIRADDIRSREVHNTDIFYWKGDHQDRLGYPELMDDLTDVTVPAWIPSQVGLGIEQAITFMGTDSGFITMSNWAPDLMRLSKLTGDSTFEMFARNAVLGRGANYPGYYQNQFMVHQKEANFPYTGPDLTSIYYHHIPVYYGILTDFLFSQAWNWSNGSIDFPYLRQQGYAYFNNRHFGHKPGRFFGQEEMWPWLKKGLLTTDNIQVDWLGARKDGVFGAAFMNESPDTVTTTVQFGEELGGSALNRTVTVYDGQGNATTATVTNGQLSVTIPARSLVGIVMEQAQVDAPRFAKTETTDMLTHPAGSTSADPLDSGDFGHGRVLQIEPSFYHAYMYVTDMPEAADRVKLHYQIGNQSWKEEERTTYPFEFTIKVPSDDKPVRFYFEVYKDNVLVKTSQQKVIEPL
ncbi:hypothetical protein [Paenibacillus beijingensis]|uniref:Uncharacterized protein n=1 Tax=Paenibacillus beijingensis TaxID=1126833 RepID=A0A0D5NK86_9BACL|nr:hypothetical protein [Paenibacillus beijingensis]AJY75343.1 hypothetical protein VN24_13125 [Paenibacillus beijingensis]